MRGTYWILIFVLIFQLLQAAQCDMELHNVSKFVQPVWVAPAGSRSPARQYDFVYFVQQWQISLCNIKSCLKPARPVFSIRGFWPSFYSRNFSHNCSTGSRFAPQKISNLKERLDMEWPSLQRENNYELWKDEWERNGACMEPILPQRAFFEAALKLKGKYKLMDMLTDKDIYPFGNVYSVDNVRDAIRTATGHNPQIECQLYKQMPLLLQVFLCLDYNAINIIDCPRKVRCKYDEVMIPYSLFGS